MIVRCWGARGGIAVSGARYTRFGGDTCCIEIRDNDNRIVIIDAGTGLRPLGDRMLEEGILECDQVFTHLHWDHLMGLPFFRVPIRGKVRVHGDPIEIPLRECFKTVMAHPFFPVPFEDLFSGMEFFPQGDAFRLGNLDVSTVPLSHPGGGLGYRFEENGRSFVFLTDNELSHVHGQGLTPEGYAEFAQGADLLVHDAEYLPSEYPAHVGWGHSHWMDAVGLAEAAGVKALGLFHHGAGRKDVEVAAIVDDCRNELKRRGADIECFAMASEHVVRL